MYTLIQLKLFRMVAETGSFNKAADEAFHAERSDEAYQQSGK